MDTLFAAFHVFFIVAAAQGIFLYFVIRKIPVAAPRLLSVYYLIFSLILVYWVCFWVLKINLFTFFLPLEMCLGPVIYGAFSGKKLKYHFLPAVLCGLILLPYWIHHLFNVPALLDIYPGSVKWFHIFFNFFKTALLTVYAVVLLYHLKRPYRYEISIVTGYYAFVLGGLLYMALIYSGRLTILIDYIIGVCIVCMIYYSGYSLLLFSTSRAKKYPKNYLDELWEKIETVTTEKRLYLSERYSAEQLSVLLSVPVTDVHQAFGNVGKTTLKKYTNYLRIEHSKEILASSNLKISMVALEAGYNNKVSFIQNFKKQTNLTPTEYRKSVGKPKTIIPNSRLDELPQM